MPKKPLAQFIIEDLARAGKVDAARRELRRRLRRKVDRQELGSLGMLAWRLRLPDIGLRLLRKVVRPGGRIAEEPSAAERAAYAGCLIQIGAEEEGLALLDRIDAARFPIAHLVRVSGLVSRWDYAAAIPSLRAFLSAATEAPYQRLIAEVNLAAALVFEERIPEAKLLVTRLLLVTRRGGNYRLHGSLLELEAILAFLEKDWAAMRRSLSQAEKIFKVQRAPEALFVAKWTVFRQLHEEGPTPSARRAWDGLRALAENREEWETVRECDHHWALCAGDDGLFWHVFFGTPFPAYRKKLGEERAGTVPPERFLWSPLGDAGARRVALRTGFIDGGKRRRIGAMTLRLVSALASDFYRPFRAAQLHAKLYPGESWNVLSSPLRLRKAIERGRCELAGLGVPLRIAQRKQAYRIEAIGPVTLEIESLVQDASGDLLELLHRRWPRDPFSARDARDFLARPERTVRRLLELAVHGERLERSGAGPSTRYRFKS